MPELEFKGKEFVRNHHLTVPYRPLIPDKSKSIGDGDLDGNLIIHGDNLHALKALLPRYAGKVDCIFIDPPYNTGNEGWSYNDNVNSPLMREWMKANPINADDMLRYDKWCCLMWPRLKLLWDLLSPSGSLWITLDDNEIHHGRVILDEVCGADKFVACNVWQKRYSRENREAIGDVHDYVMVYAKESNTFKAFRNLIDPTDEQLKVYKNPNNDPRGDWRPIPMTAQGFRKNQMYPIESPGGVVHVPPEGRCWSMVEAEYLTLLEAGRIWFGVDRSSQPNVIRYKDEIEGFVPWTWWPSNEVGHTDEAKKELYSILGRDVGFDTIKPLRLLNRVLQIATSKSSLVLDTFAGSGTTAHAVLSLNNQDGGNRRFILAECEEYADRLTAERVRRAIRGYSTERQGKGKSRTKEDRSERKTAGLGGQFSYCTLGEPVDVDKFLAGKGLPAREALAEWLLHTAFGKTASNGKAPKKLGALKDRYLATIDGIHVWLLYESNLKYLQESAALTLELARQIGDTDRHSKHLVFSPVKYVSQKTLRAEKIPVEHALLPFSLAKLERT